jgi:hypothetical protein
MNPHFSYRVFFAIPFDPAMKSMYTGIVCDLRKEYGDRLQFAFGTEAVGPSQDFLDMQAFKAQNADLLAQFRSQITSSNIIVADLTNNNPNVHVELGIAITQNKNILRVSGRNIVEVGSDIKGFFVDQYRERNDLCEKLEKYIGMFLKIKDQPLDGSSPFYKTHFLPLPLNGLGGWDHKPLLAMRDGELKAKFSISLPPTNNDYMNWFGAFIRYSDHPWYNSYLIYVRMNGMLEIAQMPSIEPLTSPKEHPPLQLNHDYTFHFKIDGSHLIASLDDDFANAVEVKGLNNQSHGWIALACLGTQVNLSTIETVCRDTVDVA